MPSELRNGAVAEETHACGMSKRKMFNWSATTETGRLEHIDKNDIRIDHTYQRTRVNKNRVLHIARNWSWQACGTIGVFRRDDGKYFAYDGQHRILAARKRDDIDVLPCWVFDGVTLAEEAKAFEGINSVRGPMKAVEQFKARVVAEDADALCIKAMLEEWDYEVAPTAGNNRICCIAAVEAVYRRSADSCRRTLCVIAEMSSGDAFSGTLFKAIAYIDQHMQKHELHPGVTRADVAEKLVSIGPQACETEARRQQSMAGKGGDKVWASGIINAINKGKRTKKIPAVFPS